MKEVLQMKACVLHAAGDLRFEEVAKPQPKQGEVLVHIMASGICGSDIPRVLTKGTYHFPTIPGHEFAGVVEEIGEGADPSWLHKHVAVFPLLPCFSCASCRTGNYAQCESYSYFGSRCDGGFSEYLAVPVWNLVEVSKEVPFEQAAMCEPAAVAYHAMAKAALRPGDNVLVVGAGTIGLMTAMWCRAAGAGEVIIADISARHLELARKLGFSCTVDTQKEEIQDALLKLTGRRFVNAAFECAGVSPALETCLNAADIFGRVVTVGNPGSEMRLSQNAYWCILRKELKLYGTWNSSYGGTDNDWTRVIQGIETGKIALGPLVTHRFALAQHKEAFDALVSKDEFTVKVMFINQ